MATDSSPPKAPRKPRRCLHKLAISQIKPAPSPALAKSGKGMSKALKGGPYYGHRRVHAE